MGGIKRRQETNQDEIEERGLIDLDEIGVPGLELIVDGLVVGL